MPFTSLDVAARYSWVKAPRYDDTPLETGPLARLLVAYVNGQPDVKAAVDPAATALGGGQTALFGTLEDNLASGDLAVVDASSWDPMSWPDPAQGWSLGEGPRGAVGHWVSIRNRVVERYQVVDGSTWNASPRDATGTRGPLEAALLDTHVADPGQPLELLRVVHSFNPCAACAVHAFDPRETGRIQIHVRSQESAR